MKRLGADHLTFGRRGWVISCKRLSEEKNYMQNKFNRKLMLKKRGKNILHTRLLEKKILADQKSPTTPTPPPPPKKKKKNGRPLK